MFSSQDAAFDFRDELIAELDRTETDGWHISPTLDGATIRLAEHVGSVRGHLDGAGYRVRDATTDDTRAEGWAAELEVRSRGE